MRNFISVISLGVALCAVSGQADATPSCAFDGVWTTTNPGGRTTFTTKFVVATHTVTVDRTGGGLPDAHIGGTFTFDAASSKITFTNTSVSTHDMAFFACMNVPGTYTVSYSDCTHMQLALVSDSCAPRTQSVPRATFTKQ